MMPKNIITGILILVALCSSCRSKESLREAGLRTFPDAQKFDRLFTKNYHELGYHAGMGASRSWASKGIVYERYRFRMSFDVDSSGGWHQTSPVTVVIAEHIDAHDSDGRKMWTTHIVGKLTEAEWRKATTIDELFELAGIVPKKHEPIPELSTCTPAYW